MVPQLVGLASVLVGLGLALPAIVGWQEQGAMSPPSYAMLVPAVFLLACGSGITFLGLRRPRRCSVPASVLGAVLVNALFLALFALEISDTVARRGGIVAKSWFFFPPALILFWGLVAGRRWAWHLVRWGSLGFALLYFGVSIVACVLQPMDQQGPLWIWIASVGVVLGSLLLIGGFYALGLPSARRHFGVVSIATAG